MNRAFCTEDGLVGPVHDRHRAPLLGVLVTTSLSVVDTDDRRLLLPRHAPVRQNLADVEMGRMGE